MEKIKNCPFCGGEAKAYGALIDGNFEVWCGCVTCRTRTSSYLPDVRISLTGLEKIENAKNYAIMAWNRRIVDENRRNEEC